MNGVDAAALTPVVGGPDRTWHRGLFAAFVNKSMNEWRQIGTAALAKVNKQALVERHLSAINLFMHTVFRPRIAYRAEGMAVIQNSPVLRIKARAVRPLVP